MMTCRSDDMDWIDWALLEPKNKKDIVSKIENDGYTYPHYDKAKRGIKYVICTEAIARDCYAAGITLADVYPLQTSLF